MLLLRIVVCLLFGYRLHAQEYGTSCQSNGCNEGLVCDQNTKTCEVCEEDEDFCRINKKHCDNPYHKKLLYEKCPISCGLCTAPIPPPCQDFLSTCDMNEKHCDHPRYREFLAEKCPATCGICDPEDYEDEEEDDDENCGDNQSSGVNCAEFKRQGMCFNFAVNRPDYIKSLCGETCGYCGLPKPPEFGKVGGGSRPETDEGLFAKELEKAARIAGGETSSKKVGTPTCGDNFRGKGNCEQFKRNGYCRKEFIYGLDHIKRNCGITCGKC